MSPHEQDLNELVGELNARLERRHIEAAEQSGQIGDLKRELAKAREERDLAIAHDRQPYPTAWAHEQACKALEKHRQRADEAEAERDELKVAIATVRADCKTMAADQPPADTDHQIWLKGVHAQATRILNILTALGVAESSEGES